jgi:putative spermidine/putrescine transport system ATP-binding protein
MPDIDSGFVRFAAVQKSYDGVILVVKDLNLDIARGEFLTMLGPSGSGKTTCLMMLAGFETATHGDIILDGESINNVPPHKRSRSTTCRRTSARSAWCSRTMPCSRT